MKISLCSIYLLCASPLPLVVATPALIASWEACQDPRVCTAFFAASCEKCCTPTTLIAFLCPRIAATTAEGGPKGWSFALCRQRLWSLSNQIARFLTFFSWRSALAGPFFCGVSPSISLYLPVSPRISCISSHPIAPSRISRISPLSRRLPRCRAVSCIGPGICYLPASPGISRYAISRGIPRSPRYPANPPDIPPYPARGYRERFRPDQGQPSAPGHAGMQPMPGRCPPCPSRLPPRRGRRPVAAAAPGPYALLGWVFSRCLGIVGLALPSTLMTSCGL